MKLKHLIAVGALAALASPLALAEDPVTRAYGVGFLTRSIPDNPGPALGFGASSRAGIRGFSGGGKEEPDLSRNLVEMIRGNIEPGSWNAPHFLKLRGSTLLIHAKPATHAQIKALLAWSRAMHARPVQLRVSVYEGPSADVEALLAGGPLLSSAALARLGKAPWRRARQARLTAFSGQRVNLASTRHVRYIHDLDSEVAQESSISAPEFGQLTLGSVDDLRPTLSANGKGLLVDVRLSVAEGGQAFKTFDTGLQLRNLQPGGGGQLSALDQPRIWNRKIRCTVYLPAGGTTVLGTHPAAAGKTRLLVLRHREGSPARLPRTPRSSGKRQLRIFDTRFLGFRAGDFKGPDLRPEQISSGGAGGMGGASFSEAAEEGTQLTALELVEMIQASIDEDSWHNTRNRIVERDGRVLVYQSPATLAKIGALAADLERARQVSVMVRARLIAVSGKQDWFVEHSGSALDAAALAALRKRIDEDEDVTEAAGLAVTGLPRQRVYAASFHETPVVTDYDAELAQSSSALDPSITFVRSGATLGVRSSLVGDGKRVMVELEATLSELTRLRVVQLTPKIRLQVPDRQFSSREASLLLSHGGAYLMALSSNRYALVQVHLSRTRPQEQGK